MNKKVKKGLVITAIVLGIIFLAGIILPGFVEMKLNNSLTKEFNEQTNQRYKLAFKQIDIQFWRHAVVADSISITPQTDSVEIESLSAASLAIRGIRWTSLLSQRFPVFKSVVVEEPVTQLHPRRISSASVANQGSGSSMLDSLDISTFDVHIKNGSGKIIQRNGMTIFSLGNFDLMATEVDVNTILAGTNVPYLENLVFSGSDLFWNLEKDLYSFKIKEFSFDKSAQEAGIREFSLKPLVPKYEFAKINATQTDRFDLSVAEVNFIGLDVDSLAQPAININTVAIDSAMLEVFHDKHVPPPNSVKYKPLLNDIAKAINFSLGIEEIKITNTNIQYGEHIPASEEPGYVEFADLRGSIYDFRSATHPRFNDDSLTFSVNTRFMDAANLRVDLAYATFDQRDTHRLTAHLDSLDGTILNPLLINLAFLEVESGFVNGMDLNMTLNDAHTTGKMKLQYENLEVNIRDRDNTSNTNLKTRISSFLVNNFVMKPENTQPDLRIGEIDFERPRGKAIFGYWWKAAQQGLENSIK